MWWWLAAALLTARAAPDAPEAPGGPLTEDMPITETPKGLVETLRRQLMQDNEDYLPSESEGIPMRARLSDDDNYEDDVEEWPARPDQLARENGTNKKPQSSPASSKAVWAKPAQRAPIEPRVGRTEIRSEEYEPRHPLEPQLVPAYNDGGNRAQTRAILTKDNISVEKYDQDYEFKENKQFLDNVQIEEQDFENEVVKPVNTLGTSKLEDNALPNPYEIDMEKHFEDKAAGDWHATRVGFMPRAHDDSDVASRAHTQLAAKRATTASGKPGGVDINISKKDLLYYMDEEKFAKSNLSIGFNADIAIDYKDFAQSYRAAAKQEPMGNVSRATKKYRVLKMHGSGGRRSGRGGRRFIQEEGATGVAILNVDAGPFPEFRLPRERRQYMHSDQSDAEPPQEPRPEPGAEPPTEPGADSAAGPDPALTPPRSLDDLAPL